MIYAWEAQNTAGDTKRKCTSGVVFVGMCTGNVSLPKDESHFDGFQRSGPMLTGILDDTGDRTPTV